MKDFNIFWGSLKNPIEGDFLKRGTWTVCRFRGEGGRGWGGGGWHERGWQCF